ncbi:hypothetical protein BDN72DRAFT_961819 [Pluteus cervinus]|uniref:Uncharacterized protein n=1 Tax=Pluteus cervinus TaxID=181527 RepID=A0ACD3ALI7_9AGAR|nr:hypothetical protein BDN72DRAFT_961819 [Pluteus cervinus]
MTEESPNGDGAFDLLPGLRDKIFSFSFPVLAQPLKFQKDRRLIGPSPFTFFDRHVNESQRLKRVAPLSTLADDLIRKVDDRLAELEGSGDGPLPVRSHTVGKVQSLVDMVPPPDQEITPYFTIKRLRQSLSASCLPFVSHWILHPRAPRYELALSFNRKQMSELPPCRPDDPREDFTMRFLPPGGIQSDILSSIDDLVRGTLEEWHDRDLGTWILLPLAPDSEQLLRSLDQLFTLSVLPSPISSIAGLPIIVDDKPPFYDADITPWTLPALDSSPGSKESFCAVTPASNGHGAIYPPALSKDFSRSKFEEMKEPTAEALVHHAWRLAVQQDTTIIVVNCGNYERIGIRHRGTRTLYLSDIIDVTKPGYGKLHLGILMAVVDDALNRYRVYREKHPVSLATKRILKRARKTEIVGNSGLRRSKRQRMNTLLSKSQDHHPLSKQDTQTLWREVNQRSILLLQFSGGGLNSSRPTGCLRKGRSLSPFTPAPEELPLHGLKDSYQPNEYFTLTLDWDNSNGLTGQVFTGQLQVSLPSGRALSRSVVAKIATYAEARERVRHEYRVYQHLWAHNIKRIPEIYGLFEDMDDLVTMIVMERAACTFRQREPITKENKGGLREVPPSDKLTIMEVVEAMHKAGVVHDDLRPDNLVLAQDGKPMVIDFDRSTLHPTDDLKDIERRHIENLLSGKTNGAGRTILW